MGHLRLKNKEKKEGRERKKTWNKKPRKEMMCSDAVRWIMVWKRRQKRNRKQVGRLME